MDIDSEALLTVAEAAQFLRCSLRTLDRERAEGRGCAYVRIGRRIRYRRADVQAFVTAHLRGGARGALPGSKQSRSRRLRKQAAHSGAAP
jgi:excisionase family DNA binding protein